MTHSELLELIAKLCSKIEAKEDYIKYQYDKIEYLRNKVNSLEERLMGDQNIQ